MIKKERQNTILAMIRSRKYCTIKFLSEQLFVAAITIRRDLTEMEESGLITKCYGGATIPEHENREVPFEVRNKSHFAIKKNLAKKASRLIHDGDVVFLDASSTVSHITDYISPEQNVTIITNSTLVSEKLKGRHIRCYLTGGIAVENSHALVGSIAEDTLSDMYANVCFFSAQGIDKNGVISDQSEAESSLRRLMIKNSKKQFFLFDSSKYNKRFAFKICDTRDISDIITDTSDAHFNTVNK